MSDNPSTNGHVTIEIPDNPPPPTEAFLIDGVREISLTSGQCVTLGKLADKAEGANEAATAAIAVARDKQAALDSALMTVFELAGVNPGSDNCLLVRQRNVIRLEPKSITPK